MFTKVRTLDLAQKSSESYSSPREVQIMATADNKVESVSGSIVRRALGMEESIVNVNFVATAPTQRRVKVVHVLLRKLLVLTVK